MPMVEIKRLRIQEQDFIGIYLKLPRYPIHLIVSTHTILASDALSISHFEDENKDTAIMLCQYCYGFDGLLNSEVKGINQIAKQAGVNVGMKAKEALMLCENTKEKKR